MSIKSTAGWTPERVRYAIGANISSSGNGVSESHRPALLVSGTSHWQDRPAFPSLATAFSAHVCTREGGL